MPFDPHGRGWPGPAASRVALLALAACEPAPKAPTNAPDPAAAPGTPAEPAPTPPEEIRFNGTYRGVLQDSRGAEVGFEYLRFSSDGTMTSLATAAVLEPWSEEERMMLRPGTFKATGNVVTFTTSAGGRTIEYAGTIRGGELVIKWRAEKDRVGSALFTFVPGGPAEAGSTTTPPAPAPPNETIKPSGTSWFCTRAKNAPTMSNCQRQAKECQKFRKEMATKLPKEKFGDCLEQPKALCHTVVARIPQRGIPLCYQQVADCEASARQIRAKENASEYEISACAPW